MQVKQEAASQPIFIVHMPSLPSLNTQVWPSCLHTRTGSVGVPSGSAPGAGADDLQPAASAPNAPNAQRMNIDLTRTVREALTSRKVAREAVGPMFHAWCES